MDREREKPITVMLAGVDLDTLEDLTDREGTTSSDVLRRALRVYAGTDVPGRRPAKVAQAGAGGA